MFEKNANLRGAGEVYEMTQQQVQEWVKCKEDIIYFATKYFFIIDLDKGRMPIPLRAYQKRLLKVFVNTPYKKKNVIVSSPRQSGKCLSPESVVSVRNTKTGEMMEIEIGKFYEMMERKYNSQKEKQDSGQESC